MSEALDGGRLYRTVQALARGVGPRPTGHPSEGVAQEMIRDALRELGLTQVESVPFETWDTWGYAMLTPNLLTLAAGRLGWLGRLGDALGGLLSLAGVAHLRQAVTCGRQPLAFLYPRKKASQDLLLRLPPTGERRHRVVLVGHVDTNKHRQTFRPELKRALPWLTVTNMGLLALHGAAQLARALGGGQKAARLQRLATWGTLFSTAVLLVDELEGYVEGANDNATAVAALLGLAEHLQQHPLRHTEVWLAFTAAEEVGCVGMHRLLDAHGHVLQNAYFIDFEMVGCKEIAYVTGHSSFSALTGYAPDPESVRLAEKAARAHPELGVQGRPMVIGEEVGALRGRGYRGICLVGVGEDGWLANWHQYSDNAENVVPEGIERAARFALAMLAELDQQY